MVALIVSFLVWIESSTFYIVQRFHVSCNWVTYIFYPSLYWNQPPKKTKEKKKNTEKCRLWRIDQMLQAFIHILYSSSISHFLMTLASNHVSTQHSIQCRFGRHQWHRLHGESSLQADELHPQHGMHGLLPSPLCTVQTYVIKIYHTHQTLCILYIFTI